MKDDLLDILLTYECPFTGAKRVAGLGAVKQELGQGRGGAWDHRRCGTCFFTAMALPSSKVVPLTIACLCLSGLPSLKGVNRSAAAPPRELSRATQATAFCFSERLSLPFARPDTFPRAPNPSNPSAGLSKATLAATRHGHPVFKGVQVQACRLPGPKPFKPFRRPFQGNSRSYTPRPSIFKGVQACRLPGPKPFKPSRRPFEGNSRSYTPRPSVFKGVQACHLPGPKPFKPSRKPFEGNSRSYTPRPSVFKGVQACRLPGLQTLPQAFRRQLSQLHATAICYFEGVQACRLPGPKPFKPSRRPFEGNSRSYTPRQSLILKAFKPAACRAPNPSNPPASLSKATLATARRASNLSSGLSKAILSLPLPGFKRSRRLFQGNSHSYKELHVQ